MSSDLLIVGAGKMARFHALAARELGWRVEAVTRSPATAEAFAQETGAEAASGGLDAWLSARTPPSHVVVAVGVEGLAEAASAVIRAGARRVLLEKPGGIDTDEIEALANLAEQRGAEVLLAYNRRFYPAVEAARAIIAEDGGATSLRFDFTELAHAIGASDQKAEVKRAWFLANSTHVIDLAFYLAGQPAELCAQTAGGLDWHPDAAQFAGSGVTEQGALFSYVADWTGPGRWSVDVRTRERRIVLEPLEELRIQKRGTFTLEVQALAHANPTHKVGIYEQMHAFLTAETPSRFVTIREQAHKARQVYAPMLRGSGGLRSVTAGG